ncbi:hypothetical protein sos41_13780 [Alphaproteobacteria bacterium SO-S41]|nr:hypothetical protein sos41_13780 [Alphaproteobacteria bacterium SO-S41]
MGSTTMPVTLRRATMDDVPPLRALMAASIGQLMDAFLTPAQVAASHELMGLDTQLIEDGTYFIAEIDGDLAGSGGWSRRATLFGGNHTAGRSDALLVPGRDRARVRAMYTAPSAARRGVGRAILAAGEDAARAESFTAVELAATLAGEPLYRACGYVPELAFEEMTSNGVAVPLIRMVKPL